MTRKRVQKNKPKVSCIVSAYYASEFLEERLRNLLAQKPTPEIIVVCQDGSKEYDIAMAAKNVTIVKTQDIPTIYDAWNMAIQVSNGEYITNSNSDDKIYPGGLKILSDLLDKNPDRAIAYGDSDIVDRKGQIIGRFEWLEGGITELVMQGCFLGPMPMWRKSLHDKYGLFDAEMKSAGDYEFWMRVAKNNEKFIHTKIVVGSYLKYGSNLETRESLRSLWEQSRAKARYRNGVGVWVEPPEPMTA